MEATGLELHAEAISKTFGETRALSEVSLSVRPSTVHAIVGENGAGKSTLGRIIAGLIRPDAGRLLLDGAPVDFGSPRDALDRGIATIAQELALVPALSAAENVLLGVEPRRAGLVDRRRMAAAYRRLADDAGFDIPGDRPVASLAIAQQQQVEILRALAREARLIVMDEPTARLSAAEVGKLHTVIRTLRDSGRSVLLISHFLAEVLTVADEVTVLRDGVVVRHGGTAAETESSLIESMLGRKLVAQFPDRQPPPADAPVLLRTERLAGPGFADVSLEVRAGEIVGLAGLIGAGRSELARAIVGSAPTRGGRVEVGGQAVRFSSPRDAKRAGVFMIPESRREQGLFFLRSIADNVTVASLDEVSRAGLVSVRRQRDAARRALDGVDVEASVGRPAATLSGGNQQKLLFARTLLVGPRVLIADEPTRGVDVGAKRQIYDILAALAAQGLAVLLISSEMEEILGLPHRVLAMRAGRLVAELHGPAISEQQVLAAVFGPAVRGAA